MEPCRGSTKAGARCKRPPSAGSDYCSAHQSQARPAEARSRSSGARDVGGPGHEEAYDDLDRLIGVVAIGFLVCVVLALRGGRLF